METLSALLAQCERNPLVGGVFASQRSSDTELGYFSIRLNWMLNLQPRFLLISDVILLIWRDNMAQMC